MAINYEQLTTLDFGKLEQTYTARDSMLYALGLGFRRSPGRSATALHL